MSKLIKWVLVLAVIYGGFFDLGLRRADRQQQKRWRVGIAVQIPDGAQRGDRPVREWRQRFHRRSRLPVVQENRNGGGLTATARRRRFAAAPPQLRVNFISISAIALSIARRVTGSAPAGCVEKSMLFS